MVVSYIIFQSAGKLLQIRKLISKATFTLHQILLSYLMCYSTGGMKLVCPSTQSKLAMVLAIKVARQQSICN